MVDTGAGKIRPYRYYEQGYLTLQTSTAEGIKLPVIVLKAASPEGPNLAVEVTLGEVITEQEVVSLLESHGLSYCTPDAKELAGDLNLMRVTIHGKEAAKQVEYLTLPFDRILNSLDTLEKDLPKILSMPLASQRPDLTRTLANLLDVAREARAHVPRQSKRERTEPWNHDAIYLASAIDLAAKKAGREPGLAAATGGGVKFIAAALARAGTPIQKDAGAIVSAWRRFKDHKITF